MLLQMMCKIIAILIFSGLREAAKRAHVLKFRRWRKRACERCK